MANSKMQIRLGDIVGIKSLENEKYSVEKIDTSKKIFQAGYNPYTLRWNGEWFSFEDVSSRYSAE
jgi:hypothetical protein